MDIDFIISKINGFDVSCLEYSQQADLLNHSQGPVVIELLKKSQAVNPRHRPNELSPNFIHKSPSQKRDSEVKDQTKSLEYYSSYPDSTYSSLNYDMGEHLMGDEINDHIKDFEDDLEEFNLSEKNYGVEYENIDLHKNNLEENLGFTLFYLEKGDDTLVFVNQIENDGIAFKDSRLQEGDQIIKINEELIISKEVALHVLHQQVLEFRIEIARPKHMIQNPLQYNDDCPEYDTAFKINSQYLDPLIELLEEEIGFNSDSRIHRINQLSPNLSAQKYASNKPNPNYAHESSSLSSAGSRRCTSLRSQGKDSGFEIKLTDEEGEEAIFSDDQPEENYKNNVEEANSMNHIYEDPNELMGANRSQTSISLDHNYESLADVLEYQMRLESTPKLGTNHKYRSSNPEINPTFSPKQNLLNCMLAYNSLPDKIERHCLTTTGNNNSTTPFTKQGKSTKGGVDALTDKFNGNNESKKDVSPISYPDIMYTNAQNLQHTINLQQIMFKRALKNVSQTKEKYDDLGDGRPSCDTLTVCGSDELVKMKWKVKRRSDGTRYIVRRPAEQQLIDTTSNNKIERGKEKGEDKLAKLNTSLQICHTLDAPKESRKPKRKDKNKKSHNYTSNPILTVTTV